MDLVDALSWTAVVLIGGTGLLFMTFAAAHSVPASGPTFWVLTKRLLWIVWWVSFVWLLFVAFLNFGLMVVSIGATLLHSARPDESPVFAILLAFYSWPAAVGVALAAIASGDALSRRKRIMGIGCVLAIIAALFAWPALERIFK